MRFLFLCLLWAFFLGQTAKAGTIETFTGDLLTGKVQLDFGGILFHPTSGPAVKMELGSVYRVQFGDAPAVEEYVPGVVLRNGVRLAAPWGPFNAPVIKVPRRNLSFPTEEIAWIVYTSFPVSLAASVPAGQTGVLLRKGDFFAGPIRGADADEAKVFNSIFGLRRFAASDFYALILRDARVPAAQYEVRTTDGSLFAADYLAPDGAGVTIKHSLYDNLQIGAAEIVEIRAGANRCRAVTTFGALHAEPAEGLKILSGRGFALSTKSVASCVAPPGFNELLVKVAADEATPPGARMVFSISADGRPIAHSTALGAGDAAQNLRVPLGSVHNLILRVDATGPTTSELHGRWIQALFIRQ
jgi:hypothetical protein